MAAHTFIRDTIIIDKDVQDFYNNFDGEGPVILLGREVRHAPGKNLVLSGRPLLIIADHYDCLDGMIDARGAHSTAPGAQGTNGRFPGLIGDRPAGIVRLTP
jgi:hypothetical protein